VRSAMPQSNGFGKCLPIGSPRFEVYSSISKENPGKFFASTAPWWNPFPLDEAYRDVTEICGPVHGGRPPAKNPRPDLGARGFTSSAEIFLYISREACFDRPQA